MDINTENHNALPDKPATEVQTPVNPISNKKVNLLIIMGVIILLLGVATGSYMLGQRNVLQPSPSPTRLP